MNRKSVVFFSAGIVIGTAAVPLSSTNLVAAVAGAFTADTYRALSLFEDVFDKVGHDYVEQPDGTALIGGAINGMVGSLDPYSAYLGPKELKANSKESPGVVAALGLSVTSQDGAIGVVSAIDGTPAARAGLLSNDLIIRIDGEDLAGVALDDAVGKLRGPVNTPVTLTVLRKETGKQFDVKLVREDAEVASVRSNEIGQVGYVRIADFDPRTSGDLKTAIEAIQSHLGKDKVQGYVVDLRNDPGGPLDQAVAVSADFLAGGEVVSIRGRDPQQIQHFNATGSDLAEGKPIIVLINGGTASASEIVAGALQDHRRATILGTKSFGDGSVQTLIPIGSDAALRLTTGRYYTPSGRLIDSHGIAPDVIVNENLPPELASLQPSSAGTAAPQRGSSTGDAGAAKTPADAVAFVPANPADDNQLNYAVDLLRGIQVNAGFHPSRSEGSPN
jgi:carboxyl-terminal processing protease